MARLLIIEDELPMRTALADTLLGHGYRVVTADDGASGLQRACEESFDLVLLDVMMPGLDGFSACRALRKRERRMPILMLTAKGLVDDRVTGLEAGADDYLVKPFSMRELLARVGALLRRAQRDAKIVEMLTLGDVTVDFVSQRSLRAGKPLVLNNKELQMLRLLAEHRGRPVSREHFLDVVWEYNAYPTTRTVDNFIATLRAKIEPDAANPRHILTVRGVGYQLAECC